MYTLSVLGPFVASESFDEGDEIGSKMFGLLPVWGVAGTSINNETRVREGLRQRVLFPALQDDVPITPHE